MNRIILPDGTVYVEVVTDSILTPVPEPEGTMTMKGSDYGVMLQDFTMEERPSPLLETNATQPDRPVDSDGRVSPQGKIIVPLDKPYGQVYWQMFIEFCGQRNADTMLVDGNGYFDTANTWGFMCSPSGGDLQHIIGQIYQSGNWYHIVERFDLSVAPMKLISPIYGDEWYYKSNEVSFKLTPHLFATRTNRRKITNTDIRWITAGGINNISWASAGREHWPLVANRVAAQPRSKILTYPSLPRELNVFPKSLVVEGHLQNRVGTKVMVDAYKFRGSNTYIREMGTKNWYLADEMLVRIPEPFAATSYDYRCYISKDDLKTPWMGNRGYRSPVPNWQRQ